MQPWPRVTDSVLYLSNGLNGLRKGGEYNAYTPLYGDWILYLHLLPIYVNDYKPF